MKKLQHVQNSSGTISKKRESGVTKRFSVLTSFLWYEGMGHYLHVVHLFFHRILTLN